jgi:hypothetical protein
MRVRRIKRIYYVYVLFDAYAIPRYVGKGQGNRWTDHEKLYNNGSNKLKDSFIVKTLKMIEEIPKVKIRQNLSNKEAVEIEEALIRAIGRIDLGTGPLTNLTDGGEGGLLNLTGEVRESISRKSKVLHVERLKKWSPEFRSNMAVNGGIAAGRLRWINDGTKQRRIPADSSLPRDWNYGRLFIPHKETWEGSRGTRWINNGKIDDRLKQGENLPEGWTYGRLASRKEQKGIYIKPKRTKY